MQLSELTRGQTAKIDIVNGEGNLRLHFLSMGIIPGAEISFVKAAPMGDPVAYRVWGYEITLRLEDAKKIEVTICEKEHDPVTFEHTRTKKTSHPGLGEMGIFHVRQKGEALSDDTVITFGLAGNQNCGKTTLFNQLTGSNQHVGNFPGVTVDRKDGQIRGKKNTLVTDLPGVYSLAPYSAEEIVTREFLLEDRPKGIINIVDATNIERNLYLTMQLMELDIPMVLALNMMDEVSKNGGTIIVNELESVLGIPVVPISAAKNEGIHELVDHVYHVAKYRERPGRRDFCDANGPDGGAIHRCLHSIMHLIEDHAHTYKIPTRFAATRLVEGDDQILEKLHLDTNEQETLEHIVKQMENESGMDRMAALALMRFTFIKKVCDAAVVKPKESKEHLRSRRIDRILTGKFTAIPSFIAIMALVFWMTFGVIGNQLSDGLEFLINKGISALDDIFASADISPVLHSLIIDGICVGVGSVLSFIPIVVILFLFLSILEDSGYMARVAFVMDKILRKIGLSGRSIVPMLIGFGCSVPAIMATRTLPSERDRKMTILLTPFMSCSAKLPIYAFFVAAFFPDKGALVMTGLYFTGIIVAILYALILKNTRFKGEPVPFVMELPNYRMPSAKSVVHLIWDKAKDFLTKAFTIIFLASIIIWFLQSFDIHMNLVVESKDSILALLGSAIAPIFAPLGFGNWRASTALITGFTAKESVVSTLTVLMGGETAMLSTLFSPFTACVFLVFTLLYTPCVAAVSSVKRELGGKWAIGVVIMQCVIAWIMAFFVHTVGLLIGLN